jgi:hypothetical protein
MAAANLAIVSARLDKERTTAKVTVLCFTA